MLIDDDLLFEDGPGGAAAGVGDQPVAAAASGQRGAGAEFVGELRAGGQGVDGVPRRARVGLFDSRDRLKAGLSRYAEHRAAGPVTARFAATTWGQHMSILSLFYRWAMDEGYRRRPSRSPTARRGRSSPAPAARSG